jgi:hypothetical protein
VLPANGTRGGIILARSQQYYTVSQIHVRQFSVTVQIKRRIDNEEWTMTGVYRPELEGDKLLFIQELGDLRPTAHDRWVLLGDFNLICRMCDKSNANVNRRLLNQFRQVPTELEMKELHLHGRRFT